MSPISPLGALGPLLAALATIYLVNLFIKQPTSIGRYATIDGLRGYLAFFVFLHHGTIWYFYLRTGVWEAPPSRLYNQFGQSSVALFFMITGFLFWTKLLEAPDKPIDWGRLFVSRIMRLTPLYLCTLAVVFLTVAILSHGALVEPIWRLLLNTVRWLTFTIGGAPDLNGIRNTPTIVAGVIWSLPYEWLFYLTLPLFAWALGRKPASRYLVLAFVGVLAVGARHHQSMHLLAFLGGITSAVLARSVAFRAFASRAIGSLLVIAALTLVVTLFQSAYKIGPMLLLMTAFSLIACGSNVFGLLTARLSYRLGDLAYGIYLLHGLILFWTMTFLLGPQQATQLSPTQHWGLLTALSPIVVLISTLAFHIIEQPAMKRTDAVTAWLRSTWSRRFHVEPRAQSTERLTDSP